MKSLFLLLEAPFLMMKSISLGRLGVSQVDLGNPSHHPSHDHDSVLKPSETYGKPMETYEKPSETYWNQWKPIET